MRNRALLLGLVVVMLAGCRVKQEKEADGDTGLEIEPAPVELQTDTKSVVVPEVNIGADSSSVRDTTTRQ
jgi:hypothetical protein